MAGKEIIYMDETTVNLWQYNRKTWMDKNRPINFQLSKDHGSSVTIIGAISTKRTQQMTYSLTDGTRGVHVHALMSKVLRQLEDPEEAVLVWDNHKAHYNAECREMLINAGVDILPLPTYSSNLNPIEHVWSVLKVHYVRELLELQGRVREDEMKAVLHKVIRRDVDRTVRSIALGGYRIMHKVLQGNIV